MPSTAKQYFRFFLVKLGLFDARAFRLAIDRVYPDDTFIVSYPKSGNTWMRFLLAEVLADGKFVDFRNLDEFVPDVYSAPDILNRLPRPRFIKAHDARFDDFPRSVYLVRDYRDAMVSYFHYQQVLKAWDGSFSQFLREGDRLHPFGTWKQHLQKALAFREAHPDRILIVRYEDLHTEPEKVLSEVLEFCRLEAKEPLRNIITRCNFGQLQLVEATHGSAFHDRSKQLFFREGMIGSWRKTWTEEDLACLRSDAEISSLLDIFGYA